MGGVFVPGPAGCPRLWEEHFRELRNHATPLNTENVPSKRSEAVLLPGFKAYCASIKTKVRADGKTHCLLRHVSSFDKDVNSNLPS